MKKKRIGAICILSLIALLYMATIIFALIDSPFAKSCLMAALFCTIVLPVLAYVYIRLIQYLKNRRTDYENEESEN